MKIYRVRNPEKNHCADPSGCLLHTRSPLFPCNQNFYFIEVRGARIFKGGEKSLQALWGCLPGGVNPVMSIPFTLPMTGLGIAVGYNSGQWGIRKSLGLLGKFSLCFKMPFSLLSEFWVLLYEGMSKECRELLQPLCTMRDKSEAKANTEWQSGKRVRP